MAPCNTSFVILAFFFSLSFLNSIKSETLFAQELSARDQLGIKPEKLTLLHFYFHDTITGQNVTAVPVAPPAAINSSAPTFSYVWVIDDPLTAGPDLKSRLVGRAQGMYVSSSQSETSFTISMNLVFGEGAYNGSTLTVLGQDEILKNPRELTIVGGTGIFRLARGYIQLRTHSFNATTGNAVVKYDAFAFHY